MIKLLTTILAAVVIQPFYSSNEFIIHEDDTRVFLNYNQNLDEIEFVETSVIPDNYLFSFDIQGYTIANYYANINLAFNYNELTILEFGSIYIDVLYDDIILVSITNYFNYEEDPNASTISMRSQALDRQISNWYFDYYVDNNNIYYLDLENDEIEQDFFSIKAYALNKNNSSNYNEGYEDGYNDGEYNGYQEGYNVGEQIGYNEGYNVGFVNGQENNFGIEGFFRSIFNVIDNVGQIEIFPSIKLWYIVAIPLIFGVLAFIIGLFR